MAISSAPIGGRLIWVYREDIVKYITIWCVPIGRKIIWLYSEDIINDITI